MTLQAIKTRIYPNLMQRDKIISNFGCCRFVWNQLLNMQIGKDDHIHLLVSAPPKLSVTNIVRWLKGISAWTLFKECPELQSSYWKKQGRHLWSPSYYVESIGTTNESAVAKYVDDQKKR